MVKPCQPSEPRNAMKSMCLCAAGAVMRLGRGVNVAAHGCIATKKIGSPDRGIWIRISSACETARGDERRSIPHASLHSRATFGPWANMIHRHLSTSRICLSHHQDPRIQGTSICHTVSMRENDKPAQPKPIVKINRSKTWKAALVKPSARCGVGMILEKKEGNSLWVTRMVPGSPASTGGICVGDELVAIDEHIVDGLSLLEISSLVCGQEGTIVNISVRRSNEGGQEQLHQISLTRADLNGYSIDQPTESEVGQETITYTSWKPKKDEKQEDQGPQRDRKAVDAHLATYSCPTCDEGFGKWIHCLKHMRRRRHVVHDYLPYVREKETKQIWVDRKMSRILCKMCRLETGKTILSDEIKAKLKPGSPKHLVAKMTPWGKVIAVRRERPTDIGNPLPPHRAMFIHTYRRPPVIRFRKLKEKLAREKKQKAQHEEEGDMQESAQA